MLTSFPALIPPLLNYHKEAVRNVATFSNEIQHYSRCMGRSENVNHNLFPKLSVHRLTATCSHGKDSLEDNVTLELSLLFYSGLLSTMQTL